MANKSLVAIVGPTGVGKSRLALKLAGQFPMEIVSADSRQVYKHLDIGTAKPSPEEQAAVRHHVLDVVMPDQRYSVVQFQRDAREALQSIWASGKMALLVGGSGYYVRSILEGRNLPQVDPSSEERLAVEDFVDQAGLAAALEEIGRTDPHTARRLDASNRRRVIRALEVIRVTGRPIPPLGGQPIPALVIGLTMSREALYEQTDRRVEDQVSAGLIDETRRVLGMGFSPDIPVLRGLAYGQMLPYIEGRRSLAEAIQDYKYATHSLIRRQTTWFRKEPRVRWVGVSRSDVVGEVTALIGSYLAA